MNNNDVIRSLRDVLKLSNAAIADMFQLSQHPIDQESIANVLKEPDEAGYVAAPDSLLSLFLDGLISLRRGKNGKTPQVPPDTTTALNNNLILKKLRIAFDLKENDLLELLSLANYEATKSELSSIFRKPGNKHYRECGDDFLMGFLVGLSFREWT